ncbi:MULTISPECIES: response regulator transcription factor [unclassified Exiguobacterium]|uniref:response regulator transcription factor n=1 Tax=unclassified Exiguobacterium TaxID=2644629 RepID=UPI0006467D06|nr:MULTISPECIES: response regulator transcription factor [unclassified Exiguobacterium]
MPHVLIVDDEPRMLELLKLYIQPYGYTCQLVDSAQQALELCCQNVFDLILMDVMMPDMDGWTCCRLIRKHSNIPILMVTARNQREDIIRTREVGANDYISKPIQEGELIGRMEVLLQQRHAGLSYDREGYRCCYLQQTISLTKTEFELLGVFLDSPRRVWTRNQLTTMLWGAEASVDERTIDSHIRHLREKLRVCGFPIEQHLETVRGIGYRWIH